MSEEIEAYGLKLILSKSNEIENYPHCKKCAEQLKADKLQYIHPSWQTRERVCIYYQKPCTNRG